MSFYKLGAMQKPFVSMKKVAQKRNTYGAYWIKNRL